MPDRNQPNQPSQVPHMLREMARLVAPKLDQYLRPGVSGGVSLAFHFQSGRLNHLKEADEARDQPGGFVGRSDSSTVTITKTDEALRLAAPLLKQKFEMTITPDFFGVVLLTFDIDDGRCIMVTCGSERIHKVPSPRIPN